MTERGEQIKRERRRRGVDSLNGGGRRLYVDPKFLDRAKYDYRFALDRGSRLHELTEQDDWEVVQDKNIAPNAVGSSLAIPADTNADGSVSKAVLLRKLVEDVRDDERAKARLIDEKEANLRSNPDPEGGNASGMYVPAGKASPTEITSGAT